MLDDFDMFATKAKQTVLYNLLDSMQIPGTQVTRWEHTGMFPGETLNVVGSSQLYLPKCLNSVFVLRGDGRDLRHLQRLHS